MLFRTPIGSGEIPPAGWRISNPFGNYYELTPGNFAYHTGIDALLQAGSSLGQPIYAIANGRVTYAQRVPTGTWGNLLVIRHTEPDGAHFYSRYGHDNDFVVSEGDYVCVGQIVGHVGDAFGRFIPHLHFDISLVETLSVNPTDWPGLDYARLIRTYTDPILYLKGQQMATPGERIEALARQIISEAQTLPGSLPPPAPVPKDAKVNGPNGVVNVRVTPGTGTVVTQLSNGTLLKVVDSETASWSKIVVGPDPTVGNYIYTPFLSFL